MPATFIVQWGLRTGCRPYAPRSAPRSRYSMACGSSIAKDPCRAPGSSSATQMIPKADQLAVTPATAAPQGMPEQVPHSTGTIVPGTVFLVSCVKRKRTSAAPARDLYISDWFVKARRYVERRRARWFILSAEYGLAI